MTVALQLHTPFEKREDDVELSQAKRSDCIETYKEDGDRVVRIVCRRDGITSQSSFSIHEDTVGLTAGAKFDWNWLRSTKAPRLPSAGDKVRIADLFSGGGMMTLGAVEALRALGMRGEPAMFLDMEPAAIRACKRNFEEARFYSEKVEEVIDGDLGAKKTSTERELLAAVGGVDVLLGGPPCQGHSDLNNHTRRRDGRNELALRMARFCELFEPRHVILENVRGILHDTKGVLVRVEEHLTELGYQVSTIVAKAENLGVPQRRHRVFLVATRQHVHDVIGNLDEELSSSLKNIEVAPRDFAWACGDLLDRPGVGIDAGPTPSEANRKRIAYLFEHGLHDLPNSVRPECHKHGGHSYKSMYGRLWWNRPAQTITTGFRSVGQGRFVHPRRRRALTAHEAARLQSIPDYYDFGNEMSTAVATLIGNAVPPKLAYAITLATIR